MKYIKLFEQYNGKDIIIIGGGNQYEFQIRWVIDYLQKHPKYEWLLNELIKKNYEIYDMKDPEHRHKGDAIDSINENTKAVIALHLFGINKRCSPKSPEFDYFYNEKNDTLLDVCREYKVPLITTGDNPNSAPKGEIQIYDVENNYQNCL